MRTLLCWLFAKNYFRDYPKEPHKIGPWTCRAIVVSAFDTRTVREERICQGDLGAAYRLARWLALKTDWNTPDADGELGVDWEIYRDRLP